MKAHIAAGLMLASVSVVSCGGSKSVEIDPDVQPVGSRWHSVLVTPPELAGIVQARGQAWMGPDPKESNRAVAQVDVENAVPGGEFPWHVHRGQCGSDQGILGPADAYQPLKVNKDGRASATAKLPIAFPKTGDFHVNVHASSKNMKTIVACGNLAPPAQ